MRQLRPLLPQLGLPESQVSPLAIGYSTPTTSGNNENSEALGNPSKPTDTVASKATGDNFRLKKNHSEHRDHRSP